MVFDPIADRSITLADGRSLAFAEWGDLDGTAVVFFHGTPHSRLWCPDVAATQAAGVHLVTVDRPGYGKSDPPAADLRLSEWTDDISQLADALELDRFGVVGWSGGAGYALACAAVIPDRLTGAGESGGAGWPIDEEPGAYEALGDGSKRIYDIAQNDRGAASLLAEQDCEWIAQLDAHPETVMDDDDAPQDLRHFDDPVWAANFYRALREGVRQGPLCNAWDCVTHFAPWGFALEDVTIDFDLWHGVHDPFEYMSSVKFWASRIPGARVTVWEDSGHFAVVDHWPEILATVSG